MDKLKHTFNLAVFLFAIWLLLSGHYTPLLLACGVLSTLLVLWLALRAELVDREIHAVLLKPSILRYWVWLGRELIRANIDVARRIVQPSMPISPNVFTVRADQRTELGQVTYANSITLLPGTVTMDIEGDRFTVHALTREAAAELQRGEMNRRVCAVERIF